MSILVLILTISGVVFMICMLVLLLQIIFQLNDIHESICSLEIKSTLIIKDRDKLFKFLDKAHNEPGDPK